MAELAAWVEADVPILFINGRDQVVHTDLVKAVAAAKSNNPAVVVDGDGYAGALWVPADAVAELVSALEASTTNGDSVMAASWLDGDAERVMLPTGAIARHKATDRAQRKSAAKMLYEIIHKGQDGPVTRYVYRPVSLPITKVLLRTPITPNMVTALCAVLSGIGVYLSAQYSYTSFLIGAALIQTAGFLDGCDGEIARLKLLSSKLGAWFDTVVDEATSVAYVVAVGYHIYQHHGEDWLYSLIFVGLATHLVAVYIIYYYLIVVAKSGNSQDYNGALEIVGGSGDGPFRLAPVVVAEKQRGPILGWCAEYFPHVLRRDFLCLMALVLAALNQTEVLYFTLVVGGSIATLVLTPEHIKLRLQLRKLSKLNT